MAIGAGVATAAGGLGTALSNIFGSLTPNQLHQLGHHLTNSDLMRAVQIVSAMKANPQIAPSMIPSLSLIPNLPPQVMTWVTSALSNPPQFQEDMTQAEASLQQAAVAPGLLGQLGL